jgi:hypothetical protein
MIRVRVGTGASVVVQKKPNSAIQGLLAMIFLAPLAVIGGCAGVVSQSSTNPPPQQAQSYTVSGMINPSAGGSGATVTLGGLSSGTTTANSSGLYTFTGLANGTYAVTPSRSGYTFSPVSQTATVTGANVTGLNFTATAQSAQTFSISGTIAPTTGGAGATVTLSGAGTGTVAANSSGAYTFSGLTNGNYTVTPSHTGYSFTPANQSKTLSGANLTGVNFTAVTAATHSATASWTPSGSVVSGYNLYRGTVSGGPYTKVNNSLIALLTFTDSTVQSGQTYFFVSTAVDGSGNESVFSNEVTTIIP